MAERTLVFAEACADRLRSVDSRGHERRHGGDLDPLALQIDSRDRLARLAELQSPPGNLA